MKIAFVVNNLGFFVSHRLPIAQKALESGFEVRLFTGKAGSQIIGDEHAQKKLKIVIFLILNLDFIVMGQNSLMK